MIYNFYAGVLDMKTISRVPQGPKGWETLQYFYTHSWRSLLWYKNITV